MLEFNEIVIDSTGKYTQVCGGCAVKYKLDDSKLDVNVAIGTCEVVGCENGADHYYNLD